jgi:hypothetical protein
MASGTYSNGYTGPAITMEALLETQRKLAVMPRIETDVTVSLDLADVARKVVAEQAAVPGAWAMRVWVDGSLGPRAWHLGKPLRERLREGVPSWYTLAPPSR